MPTKRAIILSELTADELRAKVEFYELEVYDRRVKAEAVSEWRPSEPSSRARLSRSWNGLSRRFPTRCVIA